MSDRITRFDDTTTAQEGDRLDEIVLSGAVHLEMMDEQHAVLFVGDHFFSIRTSGRCHLRVEYVERRASSRRAPRPGGTDT